MFDLFRTPKRRNESSRPLVLEELGARVVPSTTTINFDLDVDGNPIQAPPAFTFTNPLREIYSALGVHFRGPSQQGGGAILDQNSNFGVNAHSGRNFLAFNPSTHLANGGIPADPETIQFDRPMVDVSIYVAGGYAVGYFGMDAFDSQGNLVATNTVTTQDWSPLRVFYSGGIDHVVLNIIREPDQVGVFDDLSFDDGAGSARQAHPETLPADLGSALVQTGIGGQVRHGAAASVDGPSLHRGSARSLQDQGFAALSAGDLRREAPPGNQVLHQLSAAKPADSLADPWTDLFATW